MSGSAGEAFAEAGDMGGLGGVHLRGAGLSGSGPDEDVAAAGGAAWWGDSSRPVFAEAV